MRKIQTDMSRHWFPYLITAFILASVSVLWIESDLYRYVMPAMVLAALVYYVRIDLKNPERARIGWPGYLCLGWALHVLVRFVIAAQSAGTYDIGSAEGIYLFTALYPTFGYALYKARPNSSLLIPAFLVVTTLVLLFNLDALSSNWEIALNPLFFNNTIHAAFALGMVVIIHLQILFHAKNAQISFGQSPWIGRGLILINIALCLAYIFTLNSMGVWLALIVSSALIVLVSINARQPKVAISAVLVIYGVIAIGVYHGFERIAHVAGPTALSAVEMTMDAGDDGALMDAMISRINDPDTPNSMRTRLMILVDGFGVIQDNIVFGAGPNWFSQLQEQPFYGQHEFLLLHSGFLEILVRYGLVGAMFYIFLMVWSLMQMRKAGKADLVSPAVFQTALVLLVYFLAGLATNSHNRLAMGETFIWVFTSTGFYCYYKLQEAGMIKPKTLL